LARDIKKHDRSRLVGYLDEGITVCVAIAYKQIY